MHGREGTFSLARKMCILDMSNASAGNFMIAATTEPPGMHSEKLPLSAMHARPAAATSSQMSIACARGRAARS